MPTNNPQKDVRRTNVYVDSWNLYYGCLRDTPHRWINVAELVRLSMPATYQINRIRFFTARVVARPNDPQGPVRQEMLFRAMQTLPNLTMHYGNFLMKRFWAHLTTPLPDGTKFAHVEKPEEKGSDVNIATHLLVDAFDKDFDAAVVISDDSDLVEPIDIVRRKLGLHVTVLSPRGKSRELSKVATRFRPIDRTILGSCQSPATLTDANGTFTKPSEW